MKGLEATFLHSSEWRSDNDALRLDSEYQLKAHRAAVALVRAFGAAQFKEDAPEIIHPHEIIREYVEDEGVWFLRAQNVRPLQIDPRNQVMISKTDADKLTRNVVKRGDVLVTRTGANRGQCALFDRDELAVASSHTFIIRPRAIDAEFLTLFLNTAHGLAQIDKGVYGAAQPEVAPYYLGNIWIPKIGSGLLTSVKAAFAKSKELAASAETAVRDAETGLLFALGLADWTPPEPVAYQQRLSVLRNAKRMDAEHFDPRHLYAEEVLDKNSYDLLDALAEFVSSGPAWPSSSFVPPEVTAGIPFVRIRNCKPGRIEVSNLDRLLPEGVSKFNSEMARAEDIAIGMDGLKWFYAGVLDGNAYINQRVGWVRLKEDAPSADYVQLVVNSPIGQAQLLRRMTIAHTVGHVTLDDIRGLKIPILDAASMAAISSALDAANKTKALAKTILENAKRAVEIAIEDSEAAAMAYLTQAEEAV